MRSLTAASLLLLLVLMPGCKTVYSDHLIGEPIAAEDAKELEGIWRFGDSAMHVKHIEGGEFVAAFLEWEEGEFEMGTMDLVITRLGDAHFLHATEATEDEDEDEDNQDPEDGDEPWIIAGLLTGLQEHAVVLSAPEFDHFVQAIEAGVLEGEVDEDDNSLHIRGDKAALDGLIEQGNLHELFHMQEPLVITRIDDL